MRVRMCFLCLYAIGGMQYREVIVKHDDTLIRFLFGSPSPEHSGGVIALGEI